VAVQLPSWNVLRGVKWLRRALPAAVTLLVAALFIQPPVQGAPAVPAKADPALYSQAAAHPSQSFHVIVRETAPASQAAENLVNSLGGHVTRELRLIGGFSAVIPGSAVPRLTSSAGVWRLWGDAPIHMTSTNMSKYDTYGANAVWRDAIQLSQSWKYNGAGVGVAIVDTGVVPVPDLVNRIVHVVDLTPDHDGLDRYGHGTHMAGIIAGDGTASNGQYVGVAPGANLIPIKVASADGSTDVSVVIAGLQWAVSHRAQYNIRVLNLSFGTDGSQRYSIDPLDYAVEQTWFSGIFVAVAAGNAGPNAGTITKPGDDPFVVTVGADDTSGTAQVSDDVVAPFSSQGPTPDGFAKPDLVAPGISIVSDRDPGSFIDVNHPAAQVGSSYFKGTGTSQATAIVSGVAALMFQANPNLTPDLAKAALLKTANKLPNSPAGAGAGLVNAAGAVNAAMSGGLKNPNDGLTPSTGSGSLEASRGSLHVYVMRCNAAGTCQPVLVTGEVDVLGNSWSGNSWSGNSWSGNSWSGNSWSTYSFEGNSWSGNSWSGNSWSGNSWSGMQWTANSWSGNTWGANSWSGNSWSGNTWSGNSWSGNSWSGNSWSANSWSGNSWSGNSWSGNTWSGNTWSGNSWS
jgi:serine protease AprX